MKEKALYQLENTSDEKIFHTFIKLKEMVTAEQAKMKEKENVIVIQEHILLGMMAKEEELRNVVHELREIIQQSEQLCREIIILHGGNKALKEECLTRENSNFQPENQQFKKISDYIAHDEVHDRY